MKKNAIFKRAREDTGQLSREILASVYVASFYDGSGCLLIFPRHEARAVLEEIMVETTRDSCMGDLTSMLSRRDVREPSQLRVSPEFTRKEGCCLRTR